MKPALFMLALFCGMQLTVKAQLSIVNPSVERSDGTGCVVTRIDVTKDATIVSFEHTSSHDGDWVTLNSGIYLQSTTDDSRYAFIKMEGIPTKPEKHYYKATGEKLAFKAYFQKLQPQVKAIDIIERAGASNYFNFYNVSLTQSGPRVSQVRNVIDDVRIDQPVEGVMNSLLPMYANIANTMVNSQLNFYNQPGKLAELAKLNKKYYDALKAEGFTDEQALKIITSNALVGQQASGK